jgi:deazaflavin-dependent oxidoreductase (nitroreductase family)
VEKGDGETAAGVVAMSVVNDPNRRIIEEFRANGGRVGGSFESASMLLLTSTGRRSGRPHTTPLVYLADGERMIVFASKGGAPSNPDWYWNLVANPVATVEVGEEEFRVKATFVEGEQRDTLFERQLHARPRFREYQEKTSRRIPVIALERIDP